MRTSQLASLVVALVAPTVSAGEVDARAYLPEVVKEAASLIPMDPSLIVVVTDPERYLLERGVAPAKAKAAGVDKAAFLVRGQLPICLNARTNEYRLLVEVGPTLNRRDAARMIASLLYHELQHFVGRDERIALQAQIMMLNRFKARGELTIGDGYIRGKESLLAELSKRQVAVSLSPDPGARYEKGGRP